MGLAAIYARVSSAKQKEEQTIASQTAALREHAGTTGLEVPPEWVFEDQGYSGATLVRPALERLRDLVAEVGVPVILCYSPDRLARKYAYQVLLAEEFSRAGAELRFIKGPRGDTPEDELLLQFQGMIAEYERAQIAERSRRGKQHRARRGDPAVLAGAPYGYRYVAKSMESEARYEINERQAEVVRRIFERYVTENISIGELARWLGAQGIPTATGKKVWDRSTVWGMLRNPAYCGRAAFGKTQRAEHRPRVTRRVRLRGGRMAARAPRKDRVREQWVEIPVPAIVSDEHFELAQRRLRENRHFAARRTKVPSLLQGLVVCEGCGYSYYRTSTRTRTRKLYYYRCLGSDDYRFKDGRICQNRPVRQDYLDELVWGQVTGLLENPSCIEAELERRLHELRSSHPLTVQRSKLERESEKVATSIRRLVDAYQEQLLSLAELRRRLSPLRKRENSMTEQLDALEAQALDQQSYLALAENLTTFTERLRESAKHASLAERQRIVRLLVKEVLVGPERVVIRHSIPTSRPDPTPSYLLRGRSHDASLGIGVRVRYGYDDEGRLNAQVEDELAEGIALQQTHYDDDGLPILFDYPGNPQHLPIAIARNATTGLPETLTFGFTTETFTYNQFAETTAMSNRFTTDTTTTDLYDVRYERDALGRILHKTERILGNTIEARYVYDDAGRLAEVQDGQRRPLATYTYDANGNRLSRTAPTDGTSTVDYDQQDRLLHYGNVFYTYTDNGDLLTRTHGNETTSYHYDALGALTRVTLVDGTVIDYVLDGRGRRLGRKKDGVVTQRLIYESGLRPDIELDDHDNEIKGFVYLTRRHVPDYIWQSSRISPDAADHWYRVISDHLGSPRLIVDAQSGEVVQEMDYDEFGRVTRDTNPGFQPFGFAGGLYDPDTGLVHFGARDYDPETGRWTTKDPIGFAGGDGNLYDYVGQDPLNAGDPAGLYNKDVHFFLTYDSAIRAGFSHEVASFIAERDQALDDELVTSPWNPFGGTQHHFRPRTAVVGDLWSAIYANDIESFAIHMHEFQDTFSHEGYHWWTGGHFWTAKPDRWEPTSNRDTQMEFWMNVYTGYFHAYQEHWSGEYCPYRH